MSQQEVDPSEGLCGQIVYVEGDVYSQVLCKEERNGRIRDLGFAPSTPHPGSTSKSAFYELVGQRMNDVNTIKCLQEKILQNEAERVKQVEQIILQHEAERVEKEKQF